MTTSGTEYTPTGHFIYEELDARSLHVDTFARLMNMSPAKFKAILRGEGKLLMSHCERLEQLLGVSATYWANLERHWQSRPK